MFKYISFRHTSLDLPDTKRIFENFIQTKYNDNSSPERVLWNLFYALKNLTISCQFFIFHFSAYIDNQNDSTQLLHPWKAFLKNLNQEDMNEALFSIEEESISTKLIEYCNNNSIPQAIKNRFIACLNLFKSNQNKEMERHLDFLDKKLPKNLVKLPIKDFILQTDNCNFITNIIKMFALIKLIVNNNIDWNTICAFFMKFTLFYHKNSPTNAYHFSKADIDRLLEAPYAGIQVQENYYIDSDKKVHKVYMIIITDFKDTFAKIQQPLLRYKFLRSCTEVFYNAWPDAMNSAFHRNSDGQEQLDKKLVEVVNSYTANSSAIVLQVEEEDYRPLHFIAVKEEEVAGKQSYLITADYSALPKSGLSRSSIPVSCLFCTREREDSEKLDFFYRTNSSKLVEESVFIACDSGISDRKKIIETSSVKLPYQLQTFERRAREFTMEYLEDPNLSELKSNLKTLFNKIICKKSGRKALINHDLFWHGEDFSKWNLYQRLKRSNENTQEKLEDAQRQDLAWNARSYIDWLESNPDSLSEEQRSLLQSLEENPQLKEAFFTMLEEIAGIMVRVTTLENEEIKKRIAFLQVYFEEQLSQSEIDKIFIAEIGLWQNGFYQAKDKSLSGIPELNALLEDSRKKGRLVIIRAITTRQRLFEIYCYITLGVNKKLAEKYEKQTDADLSSKHLVSQFLNKDSAAHLSENIEMVPSVGKF